MPRRKYNPLCRPFLKWAGGKRQLLTELRKHKPEDFKTYFEPFLGGGALLLDLQPPRAVVNDSNAELINCYRVVRDSVEDLIALLCDHQAHNNEDYYYGLRDWDRDETYALRPPLERAARIMYLNKTCYNGLFRVNAQGQFNVPYGKYTRPTIVDEGVLRAVSHYLRDNEVILRTEDFGSVLLDAGRGDFVYLDPPYDPVSSTASFTGYDVNGFDRDEQQRLHIHVDRLTRVGCKVMLSNAHTPFIIDLYRDYPCFKVEVARSINSDPQKRGKVDEILVLNYDEQQAARRTTRGARRTIDEQRSRMEEALRATQDFGTGEPSGTLRD